MRKIKTRASNNVNLLPELCRKDFFLFSMKMAKISSNGPKQERASAGIYILKYNFLTKNSDVRSIKICYIKSQNLTTT
jgi:hypothetical protein